MGKRKCIKYIAISLIVFIMSIAICVSSLAIRVHIKTKKLSDDYSYLYHDPKFNESFDISNIPVIKQDISCGYAIIELVAQWAGRDVTEESLYSTYGKVVTSTGKSFEKEINKQIPEFHTKMYKYESNAHMLEKIYISLSNGIPVPFEWAARMDDTWTLHYSLITGIDFASDIITISNPYGYIENISIKEFLNRTSFDAYENMPLFLKFGFMFDIFEKNTIFIMERI